MLSRFGILHRHSEHVGFQSGRRCDCNKPRWNRQLGLGLVLASFGWGTAVISGDNSLAGDSPALLRHGRVSLQQGKLSVVPRSVFGTGNASRTSGIEKRSV